MTIDPEEIHLPVVGRVLVNSVLVRDGREMILMGLVDEAPVCIRLELMGPRVTELPALRAISDSDPMRWRDVQLELLEAFAKP